MKTKVVAKELALGRVMAGGMASGQWFVEWETLSEDHAQSKRFTKVMEEQMIWIQRVFEELNRSKCCRTREGCWKCEDFENETMRSSLWFEDDETTWRRRYPRIREIEYAPV